MEKNLEGKTALVVGGSRGIGRSVAVDLAKRGANLIIYYLRNDRSAQETALVIRQCGARAYLAKGNIRKAEEIEALFRKVRKVFGRLDIYVHSVGLTLFKPLTDFTFIQLRRVLELNALSFVECTKSATRLMKNGGSIVAISSLGSQRCFNDYGGIGIAKACIEAATRYLAVELAAHNIRVNAVCAGPIDTEGIKVAPGYKRRRAEFKKLTPAGRVGLPQDISKIVTFLCQDDSSWIRGQTIVADGGLSLRIGET